MEVIKSLDDGILGNYYKKVKNTLINKIDVDTHVMTYVGEHEKFYAEPEFTGKYLDLCVKLYKQCKEGKALENAKKIVESILKNIRGDGYLGCLEKGGEFANFGVWNQMFTVMGLISYYNVTKDEKVLNTCQRCIDYVMHYFIDEGHDILESENNGSQHCPILFVLSDLYLITDDKKYLDYMNYIIGRFENSDLNFLEFDSIFDLRSKKGIENFIILLAILKYAKITDNKKAIESVKKYWSEINDTQIRNTGNGTAHEVWYEGGNKAQYLSYDEKPNETCVAVGWIELSLSLFHITKEKKYLDAVDKTLYNHILASVAEDGSDFAYYQPNFGKKVKSTDTKQYKCCRYRGFTLFTYMTDMLFYDDENCIIPMIYTNASYENDKVKIKEKTNYPFDGKLEFKITSKKEKTLKLRIPKGFSVQDFTINGKSPKYCINDGYIDVFIDKDIDYEICLNLDAVLNSEYGEIDGKKVVSYTLGNVLLALIDENNEIKLERDSILKRKNDTLDAYVVCETEGYKNLNKQKVIFTDYASANGYTVWSKIK